MLSHQPYVEKNEDEKHADDAGPEYKIETEEQAVELNVLEIWSVEGGVLFVKVLVVLFHSGKIIAGSFEEEKRSENEVGEEESDEYGFGEEKQYD